MLDEICVALGGRVAESLVLGKISTGALSDLEKVTKMAYNMIVVYGMSIKIGNISFYNFDQSSSVVYKPYSEDTAMTIDDEVRKLIFFMLYKNREYIVYKIKRTQNCC